jgi:hypothetical protein
VRASSSTESQSIGFLNDVRRMNVGITRAKHCMYIVCDSNHLQRNEIWRALIDDAKNRECYVKVSSPNDARVSTPTIRQIPKPVDQQLPSAPNGFEKKNPKSDITEQPSIRRTEKKRKNEETRTEDLKRQKLAAVKTKPAPTRATKMVEIPEVAQRKKFGTKPIEDTSRKK